MLSAREHAADFRTTGLSKHLHSTTKTKPPQLTRLQMHQRPVLGHVHPRERGLEDLEAVAVRHEEDHVAPARALDALNSAR